MGSGRSVNTSPGCGSHGIPRTFRSTLLSYRCPSGTPITDCTTCVPVSSMAMSSVVFTLTPTNTPLDHLDSNLCRVHSPKLGFSTLNCLPFQTHVGSATVMMWKNGRRLGTMLDQPSKQRASGFQCDSRPRFQEVLEGARKSMHRLDRALDLSITFALALGRIFWHNFAVPTILDGIAKSDNTRLLIRLEDDSLAPHEVKVGHQSPCWIRVHTSFDGTG